MLLDVYNSQTKLGIMDISCRTGIISVIYKKGEKKDIANYWPKSLLNVDYKNYTTILKNRMQQTLDKMIGGNQTATVQNGTMLQTFSIIQDITDMPSKANKKLSVILLDFRKAFDWLDFDLILLALKKFMYGGKFIHMIKVCYSNIQSKIKVNALLSDPFTLKRGIHQGYPLSMLPYIIAAEVLANFIIVNKRIKGTQIENQEIKTVDFADDTTVFLRGISLLNRIQSIFKLRENVSSSKINVNKSQAL